MKIEELDIMYSNHVKVFRDFFNKNFNGDENNLLVFPEGDNLSIEWIFKDYRYGFYIDYEIEKSSFYFVSKEKYGELTISCLLNDECSSDLIKIINKRIS
jgi:hypothetical protein